MGRNKRVRVFDALRGFYVLSGVIGLIWSERGLGLHFRTELEALQSLPISGRHVTFSTIDQSVTNLLRKSLNQSPSFGLYQSGRLDFQSAVAAFLRQSTVNPMIEIQSRSVDPLFNLTDGTADTTLSHEFRFRVRGIPLCGFQVRGHELSDGSSLVMGNVPDVDLYEPAPDRDWPDSGLAAEKARDHLAESSGTASENISIRQAKRCFYVTNRSLLPVWEMTLVAQGAVYEVRADGYEVVSSRPLFFAADGVAKVFRSNRRDTAIVDIPLPGLKGDGSLTSEFLRTVVPDGKPRASESNNVFAYAPDDYRFEEVMVYAQATSHFDFFTKLGFSWYGPKPLEIKPNTPPPSGPNNALFQPGDESSNIVPTITIDAGDAKTLQNLVSDGDVISHEFGHHVIYKTLRSTEGESLVLHEGLADFFVFSRTGDPCLGETICPEKSLACVQVGQCLRTAANPMVYGDQTWKMWAGPYNRLGHRHSQLISGYLWDLRSSGGFSGDDLAKVTLKAVSLFAETSGFCDFLTGFLAADRELYASSHEGIIREKAEKRGLGNFLAQVPTCPVSMSSAKTSTSSGDTQATESTTKKRGMKDLLTGGRCGVAAPPSSVGSRPTVTWLVLLGPLLLLLVPKRTLKPLKIRRQLPSSSRNSDIARRR
jgi:hypothetical protein